MDGSYYVAPTEAEWEAYKACREAERSRQHTQKVLDAVKTAAQSSLAASAASAGLASFFCAATAPACIAAIVGTGTVAGAVVGTSYSIAQSDNNNVPSGRCGPDIYDVTPGAENLVSQND